MMDSDLNIKADKRGQIEDDLLSGFSPSPVLQSCTEEREHLQVYLRVRPFNSAERTSGESQDCVTIEPPDTVLLKPPSLSLLARLSSEKSLPQTGQRFQFSKVYGPQTSQKDLFKGTVKDLVKDVLEGGNALVYTYGVTNSGKTFTFLGQDYDVGVLPQSLDVIFSSIDEQVFPGMSVKPHRCHEFTRLTSEQQVEEALFKKNLLRQFNEIEKSNISVLSRSSQTLLDGSMTETTSAEEKISLKVETNSKFSVWVSFCEIYNENIHDLLEVASNGAPKRTALRLSQDVQGNVFVKDLRWIQVNSAEEAYKVVKLGKKNQSFSSTRLNQLSSRSHSIFSIRVLRIEDIETPKVHTSSELCLCDLAGSERCAKTQNQGERLKEAGNINNSLLILGKCINALRHNQQAKLLQHVPFRESKLTHYLQGFFCSRGKACMIVNISPCASMYDETLNVLKFSAVAQKVVVLSSRPPLLMPHTSSRETSFIQTPKPKALLNSKRSSVAGCESSLDDVQGNEYKELLNLVSLLEGTMDQTSNDQELYKTSCNNQQQVALLKQLQVQLKKERAENLLLEARIREEISQEFSELFSEMQKDYDERLARERDILEERAERRLEIFKTLINNMSVAGSKEDTVTMGKFLDSHIPELVDLKNSTNAARMCSVLIQTEPQTNRREAVEKSETKVLDLEEDHPPQDTQIAEEEKKIEEKKSSEVVQLEKQLRDLQRMMALDSQRHLMPVEERSGDQLKEALAALAKERKEREDILAALEYQTLGKEEALASLEEERKAREEAIGTLQEIRQHKEEMLASFEKERQHKENAVSALEAERRAREDAAAALEQEKQSREETHAALCEERRVREEVQSALEVERQKRQQQGDALQQEVRELTDKLETATRQVTTQMESAAQATVLTKALQTQLEQQCKEIQEKTSEISALTLKVQKFQLELESSELKDELSELRNDLAKEKENTEIKQTQVQELERQLEEMKLLLSAHQLSQADRESKAESLRKQLQVQEKTSQEQLDELRAQLEFHQQERDQLRLKLQEQTQDSESQVKQLEENLQQQEVFSRQQLEDLDQKLNTEKETYSKLLKDLNQKLRDQEEAAQQLTADLKEAQCSNTALSASTEELKRINCDLQAQVSSAVKEKDRQTEEKLSELENVSARREAELQKKLQEFEEQVASLQKSLQDAKDRREEEESRAVQEARSREAERRRELLAVAHEAIDQKDAELERRAQEISRLKEKAQQDSEAIKSLSLELQRKDDDSSDLREKLDDYKKQIQQVQKQISTMREEEKDLRQKLTDMEKSKKQLQSDLSSRDRTIQQLRLEQSNTKSDNTQKLYQKACEDLEAKERVIETMRLALTEQEETQEQMEQVLEEKLKENQELSAEVKELKGVILQQTRGNDTHQSPAEDLRAAREESQAQESLKMLTEKHQAERRKWLEEKLSLIGQAKEAEDKRNQEMRKFAEDRERYTRQQSHLDSQLVEKEQTMEKWRKERDTLVTSLEVQLKKLLSSQAEKDKIIQKLQNQNSQTPREVKDEGADAPSTAELQAALTEKKADVLELKDVLEASAAKQDGSVTQQSKSSLSSTMLAGELKDEGVNPKPGRTRASVSSQSSAGFPLVLESSQISTENGKTSRFPHPELEISFSPLQPNRMALRRQGEESSVTVKITRTAARKRKSGEMEKEEVEVENRRNTRSKNTLKLTTHKEETSSPTGSYNSHSIVQSKKEGTLQKIGEFLQSSPTRFGNKAKKMMSLVSSRVDADSAASSSSLRLKAKKKNQFYRPDISCPMEMPAHSIICQDTEKESDHPIIKRCLRSRMAK